MSSSEQEAAKLGAFEGLVKAVQQRDVLFVLYRLKQLDACSLNQEGALAPVQSAMGNLLTYLLSHRPLNQAHISRQRSLTP